MRAHNPHIPIIQLIPQQILGTFLTAAIFYGGYYHLQLPPFLYPPEPGCGIALKLGYILTSFVAPFGTFVFSIFAVMIKRLEMNAGNPLAGRDHLLAVDLRFAQNTLEQLVVLLTLTTILATFLEGDALKLVPLIALVFTIGRVLYRVGYGINPAYRAIGMMLCLPLQHFVLGLCVYFLWTRGLLWGLEVEGEQTPDTAVPISSRKEL